MLAFSMTEPNWDARREQVEGVMALSAIVARTNLGGLEYLIRKQKGLEWTAQERDADHFQNIREATRAAMRAPSRFRAFALPVSC